MSDENRLIDIEIKLADQENLVDTLNRTIYEQAAASTSSKPWWPNWPNTCAPCVMPDRVRSTSGHPIIDPCVMRCRFHNSRNIWFLMEIIWRE
jgi:hypothetical protein